MSCILYSMGGYKHLVTESALLRKLFDECQVKFKMEISDLPVFMFCLNAAAYRARYGHHGQANEDEIEAMRVCSGTEIGWRQPTDYNNAEQMHGIMEAIVYQCSEDHPFENRMKLMEEVVRRLAIIVSGGKANERRTA